MTSFLPLRVQPIDRVGATSPELVAQSLVFRQRGRFHVTVMVKLALELVQDGPMHLAPAPLFYDSDQVDGSGVGAAESDARPSRRLTDITLIGQAYAPGHTPTDRVAVRLAVIRPDANGQVEGGTPLFDKSLLVVGQRFATQNNRNPIPTPFVRLPISYAFALGGPHDSHNPVGVGREADASGVLKLPCVLTMSGSANSPGPLGFGPIPKTWPDRARIGSVDPRRDVVTDLPDDFDFDAFQCAPFDQRVELLRGDEWIYIENMRPYLPRLTSRLPDLVGEARVETSDGVQQRLPLRIDGLAILGDQGYVLVTCTGTFSVENERAFSGLSICASVLTHGRKANWPQPKAKPQEAAHHPEFKGTMIMELPDRGSARPAPMTPRISDEPTEDAPSTQVFTSSFERSRTMFLSIDAPPSTHSPFRLGKPHAEAAHGAPIPGAPWEDVEAPVTKPAGQLEPAPPRSYVVTPELLDPPTEESAPPAHVLDPEPLVAKSPPRKAGRDVWAKHDPAPEPAPLPPKPKVAVPTANIKKDLFYGRFRKP